MYLIRGELPRRGCGVCVVIWAVYVMYVVLMMCLVDGARGSSVDDRQQQRGENVAAD